MTSRLLVDKIEGKTTASTVEMPSGSVVQTVFHSFNDETEIASTSFTDCTGSSFTFTPKFASSKLIISFNASFYLYRDNNGQGGTIELNVDGSRVGDPVDATGYEHYYSLTASTIINYLFVASKEVQIDASNTNAKTIKLQARAYVTSNSGKVEVNENGNHTSTIKVQEIAQ